jgi:hypothetical protein
MKRSDAVVGELASKTIDCPSGDQLGLPSVPFSTTLYPDTIAHRNVLRKNSDGYELTTHYSEFAPGHGFSTELTERETLTREQLRQSLQWAKRDECVTE